MVNKDYKLSVGEEVFASLMINVFYAASIVALTVNVINGSIAGAIFFTVISIFLLLVNMLISVF